MNILLIEDNPKLSKNVSTVLKKEKYMVEAALTGGDGLHKALMNNYDLIILDLALPDIDGTEVCKKFRAKGKDTPILMLTARIDLESKVTGLDIGADDYLTKPFLMEELLARIRALLRRNKNTNSSHIDLGKVIIDLSNKQIRIKKDSKLKALNSKLSPNEYRILEFLALNRGQTKNAVEIYESVWGSTNSDILFSDTLKVHIAGLRKKLGKDIIKTVKGFGYCVE